MSSGKLLFDLKVLDFLCVVLEIYLAVYYE